MGTQRKTSFRKNQRTAQNIEVVMTYLLYWYDGTECIAYVYKIIGTDFANNRRDKQICNLYYYYYYYYYSVYEIRCT